MLDSTTIRVHRHASDAKKGAKKSGAAWGLTTKVHGVTDGFGSPLRFLLSGEKRHDICMAQKLLKPFDLTGKLILGEKKCDSTQFIRWIEERGGIVVISNHSNATCPRDTDCCTYKERYLIKKLFLKLKNHRRFSTKYEKTCF